jgi:hypothetical protein
MRHRLLHVICVISLIWTASSALADLSLETETARLVKPGHFELSIAGEYQHSPQGEEQDLPMAIEFGVIDRLELLIEPVPYTRIRPSGSPAVHGLGDTEITATYLLLDEKKYIPAIAGAFEVKIPTAHNLLIGSRVTDFRLYLAASKAIGDFDFSANVGYNIIGEPAGVRTKNPIDLEFAIEWFCHPKFDLFAEVNYVDSSRGSGGTTATSGETGAVVRPGAHPSALSGLPKTGGAITAEILGTEIIGTVGLRYHLRSDVDVYGSVSYDNHDAVLYRLGITYKH